MIDVGKFPRTITMPGSGALQFPIPGTLLIGSLCPFALLGGCWTARLREVPIEGALSDRLDVVLEAGALVGHKDLAGFLLFGASIPLCNRFSEETTAFLGGFRRPIAARGSLWQESDVAIAIGGLGIAKVGHPIANGPRRRTRVHFPLLVLIGLD